MTTIRRSRPEDGGRVIDVWRAAVDATHQFLSREDRQAIDEEVQVLLPQMRLWLAVDGHDRAFAFMGLTDSNLDALFVHPDHHDRGVGRSLVEHALARHPVLTVDVNEQNGRALGFYERLGFVRTGRSSTDEQGRCYPLLHLRIARPVSSTGRHELSVRPEHDLSPADIDAVEDRLYEYNQRAVGRDDGRGLAFTIRNEANRLVGAAAGYSWAGTAELKQLWVDEACRGDGYGRQLLEAFVAEAARRGVRDVWVASFDFQAPGFYERAGFERMAELADWPPGHVNVFLRKTITEWRSGSERERAATELL